MALSDRFDSERCKEDGVWNQKFYQLLRDLIL
jgi:hypothetical protein